MTADQAYKQPLIWVGNTVRQLRNYRSITQNKLAELTSEKREACTISRIEHGKQGISAKIIDGFLWALGEHNFPWAHIFCAKGLDELIIRNDLLEEMRYRLLLGQQDSEIVTALLDRYSKEVDYSDPNILPIFLNDLYLSYPDLTPDEILSKDLELLHKNRDFDDKNLTESFFLPNENEKMIIADMAIRYMDKGCLQDALDLWLFLLDKHYLSKLVTSSYERQLATLCYNASLCYLLSDNISKARQYADKAHEALTQGGDIVLYTYFRALDCRILLSENDSEGHQAEYAVLEYETSKLKRTTGFIYSANDLFTLDRPLQLL